MWYEFDNWNTLFWGLTLFMDDKDDDNNEDSDDDDSDGMIPKKQLIYTDTCTWWPRQREGQ